MRNRGRLAGITAFALGIASLFAFSASASASQGGWYEISNQNSGKYIDVRAEENYYQVGARIQQYHGTGVEEQKWAIFLAQDNNYTFLVSKRSGYCMQPVQGGGAGNGEKIEQAVCSGEVVYQQWRMFSAGPGLVRIVNKVNGKCLDVPGGTTSDGALLQLYTCNGTGAQIWQFH
jgi:hypothetical protein